MEKYEILETLAKIFYYNWSMHDHASITKQMMGNKIM